MIDAIRLALGVAGWLAAVSPVGAQAVVPVHEEPRHRLVHDTPELRVLDILIEPGDTTLYHRHDAPVAYVQIDASVTNSQMLGGPWGMVRRAPAAPRPAPGRVSLNERYADEAVSHRVTALGPGPFRLIAVIHRGSDPSGPRTGPLGPFTEPDGAGEYLAHARRELRPGATLAWVANDRPVVMVLASGGPLAVAEGEGERPTPAGPEVAVAASGPGDFLPLVPGASYRVVNRGEEPAVVAFVEVR